MSELFINLKNDNQVIHPLIIWKYGLKFIGIQDQFQLINIAEQLAIQIG